MNSIFKFTYINKTIIMSNFIHFGCWNNLNKGCLKNVMDLLEKRLQNAAKPKIDFLTIAGDNYYPKKKEVDGKKKKIIIPSLLETGFKSLPPEIPIYMILGNHDLETKGIEPLVPVEEKDDCSIIKYEKISKNKNGNIEYNLFKEFMLENGTLILMIDTSMYSVDVGEYLPCYNYFLERTFTTTEELRAYQFGLIMKTLTKYNDGEIKNLIIIGHHPIIGLKQKNGNDARINDIIPFDIVLKETKVPENDGILGTDGTDYLFYAFPYAGYQWNKGFDDKPSNLIEICEMMSNQIIRFGKLKNNGELMELISAIKK